jgi:DNA polymerase/3'-5' exonuclease PolX
MSNWGKSHQNNNNGFGKSSNNEIGFGTHNYIPTFTKHKIKEMIQKINRKEITVKEQIKRIKRPGEIETIRTQVKVNSPQAKRYVASLKRNHTPIINKVYKTMLASKHEVITMEQFEKLLKEYPEVEKLTNKGKQSFLNSKISTVQAYDNGSLVFTIILSEGVLYKFVK